MMPDELIDIELRSCASAMSLKEKKELLEPKKQVPDLKKFGEECQLASKNPVACVKRLVRLAKRKIERLVKLAEI